MKLLHSLFTLLLLPLLVNGFENSTFSSIPNDHKLPFGMSLDKISFFGSGCPDGTVQLIPSTDGSSLSVLFSDYIATTSDKTLRVRKACNVAVKVLNIPKGLSIGILKVEYRGNVYVPSPGGKATFNAEYFFAGTRGTKIKKKYGTGTDRDVIITNKVAPGKVAWSKCQSSDAILRINTAIVAKKIKAQHEDVEFAIDTADASSTKRMFKYHLTIRRCKK